MSGINNSLDPFSLILLVAIYTDPHMKVSLPPMTHKFTCGGDCRCLFSFSRQTGGYSCGRMVFSINVKLWKNGVQH